MSVIFSIIYYVVPFLVLLGVLVFVHEFGHYIVAKMSGVKVEEFSVGFGKEIWGKDDKSGTHWKIGVVPLGGYCKFFGDADASSSTTDNEKIKELTAEEKKVAFPFQHPLKKMAIVLAGPAANYLFAIIVFTCVFAFAGRMIFPPVVGEVIAGSPAEVAGIQQNDRILRVNGKNIEAFNEIRREVELAVDRKVKLEIERGEEVIKLELVLQEMEIEGQGGKTEIRPLIGVKSLNVVEVDHKKVPIWVAFRDATIEVYDMTEMTLRAVGQMITGKRGGEDIGGIIRIAEMSGDISKDQGLLDFVIFMALLSVNLGLINLFPIPVLDGGHIVIYTIEMVTRREINEKFKDAMFKIGVLLIVALMLFATWNDLFHLFNRWFS